MRPTGPALIDLHNQMEAVYRDLPLASIPWNVETPPDMLVELVGEERVLPCRGIDLGCGAGNYAVWFAARGFEMTGFDLSAEAIGLANGRAREIGVDVRFVAADLTGDLGEVEQPFDFAYDWEVLHHVFPDSRKAYADNVGRLLRPGGRYVSVCFSEEDPDFGGTGKVRSTPLGTTLYFSSEDEIRGLLAPSFQIEKLSTSEVAGKYGPHKAVVVVAYRR